MKQTIKTVIAREGLIVIGLVILASVLSYLFQHNLVPIKKYLSYHQAVSLGLEEQGSIVDEVFYELETGFSHGETLIPKLFAFFYTTYLLFRFTVWAIGVLLAKNKVT